MFEIMAMQADKSLFLAIVRHQDHVLHHLCKEHPAIRYNLHIRLHPFKLPTRDQKYFIPDNYIAFNLHFFA